MSLMNKWFTKYLHGIDNGVEDLPKSWIVREGDEQESPTSYPDYPHPDAQMVEFFLSPGAPASGTLTTIKPTGGQQAETLLDNFSFDGSSLAKAEYTGHRLMYKTSPLEEDVHISGEARIKISIASSKEAANLSVWLVSLPWDEGRRSKITDNIITRGWADPQNHSSIRKSEKLLPGKFYDLEFTLQPDDQIIRKGQQIGLMIFGSDKEFTLWPDPGTEVKVDLVKTSLMLPIVGGASSFSESN